MKPHRAPLVGEQGKAAIQYAMKNAAWASHAADGDPASQQHVNGLNSHGITYDEKITPLKGIRKDEDGRCRSACEFTRNQAIIASNSLYKSSKILVG